MVPNNYEEIVTNYSSPTLVLAGPGAGKTYLLADRIKRLLDKAISKDAITVLTFGKDARENMYKKLIDPNGKFRIKPNNLPHISTMHSLGLKIVQEKPRSMKLLKKELEVQDDDKIKQLMYRDAALILDLTENDSKEAIKCKQYGDCQEKPGEKKCKVCRKYREIMSKCNYIDFDDQILFACKILENNSDILKKYQSQAEHLLIDEYQDINTAQFRLIELLSRRSRNGLFAVGDDAQNIYTFRGSDSKFILHFDENFPGAVTPPLENSRRCHENIMEDAFKVIENYYTDWSGKPELTYYVESGDKPYIWQFPSELAEAEMVAKIARYFIPEKTVLILAPKKEFFPLISNALNSYNVPHESPIDLLPERIGIVKHFINWVLNPYSNFITRLVIEDLINSKGVAKIPGAKKNRRCTPETIQKRIIAETEIAKLWELIGKGNNLFSVIENIEKSNRNLLHIKNGLLNLLNSYNNFKRGNKGEFLKQLSIITGIWCNPSKFSEDISNVIELIQSRRPTGPGFVELKTMRKAKGLEADIVMIVGLENDIVPNPKSDNIAEEARLFYVSMTRAKEKLYLFHSYKRPRGISFGQELMNKVRSRFLDVIERESEWKGGKKK
jgi:DNA helicase II / ATP-dependent DNA helicase PcrA